MKGKKLIIPLFAVIILVFILILFNAESVRQFYSGKDQAFGNSVTIEIDAHTVLDNYDKLDKTLQDEKYIPKDGIILPETTVYIDDNDSVFDALKRVTKENKIQIEYSALSGSAYIEGINYLYEFSCGDLSGWMYTVNGEFADVGCDSFTLHDGDVVKWIYTCDLGRDIGGGYE